MFDSIFKSDSVSVLPIFICVLVSLIDGIILAFLYNFKSKANKDFLTTIAILPAVVTIVIALVNGNIGAGIAVAGAFSLIRFRSAPGTAKEICIIFVTLAAGLAFGMGYIAYGVIFSLVIGLVMLLLQSVNIFNKNDKMKNLRIVVPENLNYMEAFNEVFSKYTTKYELVKAKTTNLGSMYKLSYNVTLKNVNEMKLFIDDLRCLNGNLEISLEDNLSENSEL